MNEHMSWSEEFSLVIKYDYRSMILVEWDVLLLHYSLCTNHHKVNAEGANIIEV